MRQPRNNYGMEYGSDLLVGVTTDDDQLRFARYAETLAFYDGNQWLGKRRRGETRLTFNYARTLVRKVAAYVFPAPVTFSVPSQGDDATANRAEKSLAEAITENDLARLDVELCIEASVLGDAALKVTWDTNRQAPVVVAVDPATVVAWWATDNPRNVDRVAQAYGMTGAALARTFGTALDVRALSSTQVYPVIEDWTAERWTVEVPDSGYATRRTRTAGFRM
jgi:hypothetical protein